MKVSCLFIILLLMFSVPSTILRVRVIQAYRLLPRSALLLSLNILNIYQLVRVTRHLNDREFKINILRNHYCYVLEHGLKCRETYFVP